MTLKNVYESTSYAYFLINDDPEEQDNLYYTSRNRKDILEFENKLKEYFSNRKETPSIHQRIDLDEQQREVLKALGYLE